MKKKHKLPSTFEEAYEELQQIALSMEDHTVSVDQITQTIERAKILVDYCREKLRSVEENINLSLDQNESQE